MNGFLEDGTRRFLSAEVEDPSGAMTALTAGAPGGPIHLAGIGTTAPRAVRGELLIQALTGAGYRVETAEARSDPEALFGDLAWQLAVVLSPWKQDVAVHCGLLAPSAAATGVVDTVIRTPSGTVGFNTNTWAALTALEAVTGGRSPVRVLLLGAGASARSVALAVQRAWPAAEVVVAARSAAAAAAVAEQFGGHVAGDADAAQSVEADVVVNTTTWGETEASEAEPFAIDLTGVFGPGVRLFDLNNRVGALPVQALAAGAVVLSGTAMQRATNAARAALAAYAEWP